MNRNAARQGANLAEILIVVAILVGVNVLGYYLLRGARFDVTENKQYTISDATKKVLRELKDPVHVEFFMSREVPPILQARRDDIRDKLDEFVIASGGKFNLKYTDPGDDQAEKDRAQGLGVPEVELQVVEKEQASSRKVFFGLVMNYREKSEAMPQVFDPTTLEYEITSRLVRLGMKEKPKIGFFAGPININQESQGPTYQGIHQLLSGQEGFYEVVDINPETDKKLPDGLAAVIVCGAFGMSESLKYSLDQYIMTGGNVLIALDPAMDTGGATGAMGSAYPALPTIEDQLEKYGIKINKKLIADTMAANAQFQAGFLTIMQPYPLWPRIGPEGINDDYSPVSNLEAVVMPQCAPMSDEERPGVTFTPLFYTSKGSFLLDSPFNLEPRQNWDFLATSSTEQGPFKVAYRLTGAIPSAFTAAPAGDATFTGAKHLNESDGNGQLIVMSSALALSDNTLRQFQENVLLVDNLAAALPRGDDLVGIRSTPVTARPLKQLDDTGRNVIRWLNVVGIPLLLVAFGMLLWMLKGRRRQALQRKYSH
jgi:ABC-2 type transport system permease protein